MFNTTNNNNNNNQTFKVAMCGSRKYPYPPPPHPQQKIIGNFEGEGGVKEGNFQGVGGFMGNYFSKRVTNQIQNIESNIQSI